MRRRPANNEDKRPMLPYGRQTIEQDDINAVIEVLQSDFLTTGPKVPAFETELKRVTEAQFAVACSNGTAALHLACTALELGPGDYVIVPAITFLATANAVRMTGANVVFADVDPSTGLMTPQTLSAALHRVPEGRARAVIAVHLAGQVCDMRGIAQVARTNNLGIIEDSCHALGSKYGRYSTDKAGDCKFSDMATFSFHPVKTIATGEGGAVTTNNAMFDDVLRRARSHGMQRVPESFKVRTQAFDTDGLARPWYYEMSSLGYNYRMPDILCALGISQLKKLDQFVEKRRALVAYYKEQLADMRLVVRPTPLAMFTEPAWHLMVVLVDWYAADTTRARAMHAMKERGVGSQVHYIPVYKQPYYCRQQGNVTLAGAEMYYDQCLSLPLYPSMTEADVDTVISALRSALPLLNE